MAKKKAKRSTSANRVIRKPVREKVKKDAFDSLALNAFDFLKASLHQIESDPKYSIINFYTAVEIIFKARLLKEHWSLIVSKPENANYQDFLAGKCHTANLSDCNKRLLNIANSHVSPAALAQFEKLREHRNRLIHFYNKDYIQNNKKAIEQVISEQCTAWYHLHHLLTAKWRKIFERYQNDIATLNGLMLKNKRFLKSKYDNLKTKIKEDKKKGQIISQCFACQYGSSYEYEEHDPLYREKCIVCDAFQWFLKVPCPNDSCGSMIYVYESAEGACEKCGEVVDLDYLIDTYGEHASPKQRLIDHYEACCCYCCHERETVVPLDKDNNKWLCLYCLELHNQPEECEYCGDYVTGEQDYAFGCMHCSGAISQDNT